MNLTKAEAATALDAVRQAQASARAVFRAHCGHYHLWLWGGIWIVMALAAEFRGLAGVRLFPWLSAAGIATSAVIGFLQGRQLRQPVNRRFFGAIAALLGFAAIAPAVLGVRGTTAEIVFAYIALVVAQAYVVAGLWFDTYLTWLGLLLAGLVLAALFLFPGAFWIWIAIGCGGALIGTGFYIRYFWR